MQRLILLCLLLICFCSEAADEANIIVATDWSKPVESDFHPIQARLLIVNGSEPAYGGPKTDNHLMMFVELKNSAGACCGSDKLYFDAKGLKLNLVDAAGKQTLKPTGMEWSGRGAFKPTWVVIPYNSTIRLYVNGGTKSPLTICQSGEPWSWWEIPSNDTNTYFLSGTLTVATTSDSTLTATPHDKANIHEYANWEGTLGFPRVGISVRQFAK